MATENEDTQYEETTVEYQIGKEQSTVCEHEMVRAQSDPNSDLVSYQCVKCPHGENRKE